jgi:hypothetical protein
MKRVKLSGNFALLPILSGMHQLSPLTIDHRAIWPVTKWSKSRQIFSSTEVHQFVLQKLKAMSVIFSREA